MLAEQPGIFGMCSQISPAMLYTEAFTHAYTNAKHRIFRKCLHFQRD